MSTKVEGLKIVFIFLLALFAFHTNTSLARTTKIPYTVNITNEQPHVPVLCMKPDNIVLKIKIQFNTTEKHNLKQINLNLTRTTNLSDIETVRIYYVGSKPDKKLKQQFGIDEKPAPKIHFNDKLAITDSCALFEVAVTLNAKVNLLGTINVFCESANIDSAIDSANNVGSQSGLRLGVALRQHNNDQADTYRIPGLATSVNGTLLAVYDVRYENNHDLQGNIDIGLSRSTDQGNTWEPMRIVLDRGEWGGFPQKYNGVSDPCILVDQNSKKIFIAGLWMYGVLDEKGKWIAQLNEKSTEWNHPWQDKGSQPGVDIKETAQFLITRSTDDGKSWSEPINITPAKHPEWWLFAPAPGHGITLDDGTLVFPTQGRDENGLLFSNITWSKDSGETWHTSNISSLNTNENMVVQLSDGSIMMNARNKEPESFVSGPKRKRNAPTIKGRKIYITTNLGKSWGAHSSSGSTLIDPDCMASLHRHFYTENGVKKSILIFINPNTKNSRNHITLKVSFDDGETWPEKNWLLLDEGEGWGYSCITSIDEQTIGILYESSIADLVFQKIPLKTLIYK